MRFNIRTKNTNIFNSEEFGYKKISVPPYQDIEVEVEMSIHRLDNSYYCVLSVQMYAGSTTKIYSGSVLVCNASEFLMRPILSGNITNDSTSDPNNITVYLGPAINKSYRSLSNK